MAANPVYLLQNPTDTQARKILQQYAAAIEPNFVYWMSAAHIAAKSDEAKRTVLNNLECEIRDDHRGMLRTFVSQVNASPDSTSYAYVASEVKSIHAIASKLNGAELIDLMSYLENESLQFIPYLANIAKQLGATNFQYADTHGEADIAHAKAFSQAYIIERQLWKRSPQNEIDVFSSAEDLMDKIFTPRRE